MTAGTIIFVEPTPIVLLVLLLLLLEVGVMLDRHHLLLDPLCLHRLFLLLFLYLLDIHTRFPLYHGVPYATFNNFVEADFIY